MIDTIKEIKQASQNEAYKTLDVKVGIHTGKVIAGIIGSKVVRYDIFGEGVVIANKIEQVSGAGTVSISEDTRLLIQSQADVAREYDIQEYKQIHLKMINRSLMTYTIKKSEDLSHDDASDSSNSYGEELLEETENSK